MSVYRATTSKHLYEEMAWDMPEPRTLIGRMERNARRMGQAEKKIPDYAFDTPLPPTATPEYTGEAQDPVSTGEEHDEAMSLSDLAPEGLD